LVKLCVEENVHYCDITGETDFVRSTIELHDRDARLSDTVILHHCGNDCVPQDILVYEMNRFVQNTHHDDDDHHDDCENELIQVQTYVDLPDSAEMSGGTTTTAIYQFSKNRNSGNSDSDNSNNKPNFDPLLTDENGEKTQYITKNISPKSTIKDDDIGLLVAPWIMAPVMVNCIRRSNSLLRYSKHFRYGDCKIEEYTSYATWLKNKKISLGIAAAIVFPPMKRFLIQPGDGPSREIMESGYLTLRGIGIVEEKKKNNNKKKKNYRYISF